MFLVTQSYQKELHVRIAKRIRVIASYRSNPPRPKPGWLHQKTGKIRAPPIWHTPSPATWRRRHRTGSVPGSAGRPLQS